MKNAELVGQRLREICLALPEVSERVSHGSPSFFIREKKVLCNFHPHVVHGEHGMSIWAPLRLEFRRS